MGITLQWTGKRLARFLSRERPRLSFLIPTSAAQLRANLKPGDVLLVEGSSRASSVIKFLTQSNWSHAALYVGDEAARVPGLAPGACMIEADMVEGVRAVCLEAFTGLHTRICRPFGLNEAECLTVARYAVARIGQQYDLRNIFDLLRYLLPVPSISGRMRSHLLALGSGDPTRAICSTLIAQAFQSIRYPILPQVVRHSAQRTECPDCVEEFYRLRHHSLFTPRDFDVSPYFQIVKPMQDSGFDYKSLQWGDADGTVSSAR
ncbi:YiiX/YebB-like N1pC/P60 family cysteine hydrolase [Ferrigenium sp. UT5]|uniref:YiiX/YebB-like N1pC/P60 family cysteine hydrolase n=1 Tax=Ferrigenium sp. UT5 TaxID=3242105 RepID=UPI00354CC6B2